VKSTSFPKKRAKLKNVGDPKAKEIGRCHQTKMGLKGEKKLGKKCLPTFGKERIAVNGINLKKLRTRNNLLLQNKFT